MIDFLLNLDPVAFQIGPLIVRWYSLAYLAGFILGWRYALYLSGYPATSITRDHIDDFLPWAILATIIGGRLGYVSFYQPAYYATNPAEILMVWQGGMAFHGGLLGVILACLFFTKIRQIPFWQMSDILCCVAPIGLFFGRIANFINGELYGKVTTMPWGVVFAYGGDLPRHPSQLYEAFLEGLVLLVILFLFFRRDRFRNRAGFCTGIFFIGYGLSRFIVEFVREPDIQIGYIWQYFTMGQLLSVPMILFGLALIILSLRVKKAAKK